MQATDILNVIGRPNAYYPRLAKYFGGVNSAVLFSQLFYWQGKATSELGVYKTRDELEEETGLTHNEQRTAIKKLVDQGILIITEKRLQHKTYYKIDNDVVNKILSNFATSNNPIPPDSEHQRPDLYNVDTEISTKSSSLYQENTALITSKNTFNKKIYKKDLDLSNFKQQPSEKVWCDYLEHRKNKRAKLTQTALDILIKQINICIDSGYSTDEILAEIMMRGWQGFKAEWIIKPDKPRNQNQSIGQSFKNTNYGETKQPKWADLL